MHPQLGASILVSRLRLKQGKGRGLESSLRTEKDLKWVPLLQPHRPWQLVPIDHNADLALTEAAGEIYGIPSNDGGSDGGLHGGG